MLTQVLLTPGYYYHPWQGKDKTTTAARGAEPQTAHFRFSFATPSVSPDYLNMSCMEYRTD